MNITTANTKIVDYLTMRNGNDNVLFVDAREYAEGFLTTYTKGFLALNGKKVWERRVAFFMSPDAYPNEVHCQFDVIAG